MADSAVVDSALVDAAYGKSSLISNGKELLKNKSSI